MVSFLVVKEWQVIVSSFPMFQIQVSSLASSWMVTPFWVVVMVLVVVGSSRASQMGRPTTSISHSFFVGSGEITMVGSGSCRDVIAERARVSPLMAGFWVVVGV